MAHATAKIDSKYRRDTTRVVGMAAGLEAFGGEMCGLDADGRYDPNNAVEIAGVILDPQTDDEYDNSAGGDDDKSLRVREHGTYQFGYHATAGDRAILVGCPAFYVDNQTLSADPNDGPYFGVFEYVDLVNAICRARFDKQPRPQRGMGGASNVATVQSLTAMTAPVFNRQHDFYPVIGSGGAVVLAADFPDGDYVGQQINLIGTHNTNTVTIPSGIKTKTQNGTDCTLGANSLIAFLWGGLNWQEIYRSFTA